MSNSRDLTKGKLFLPMLKFAAPTLAAHFLQTLYGAVDMAVVGRFASAADVSAISTGTWIMILITAFVGGISVGITVLLGRRLGEGRPEEAGGIICSGIKLLAGLCVLITIVTTILAPQIASLLRVPGEAMNAAVAYIRICSAGSVCIAAYNLIGSIFRGIGDSTVPFITVAIACAVNIAADLLLVGVFDMAAAGAAIATVFAQLVSVLLSLLIIAGQKLPFKLAAGDFKKSADCAAEIFRLGFPAAMQDVLVNISFLVITAIVNSLGVVISAGVGVAEKLCGFIMLAPSAFSQTLTAIVAQNMGAQRPDRAKKALLYGVASSLAVAVVMSGLSFFHGDIMAAVFNRDSEVVAAAAEYLKAYAIDTLLVSVMFCMVGYFNGCGKTVFTTAQGVVGAFCVRIPVSFLMSRTEPVSIFHIGLATPASTLVQVILCVLYFVISDRQSKAKGSAI